MFTFILLVIVKNRTELDSNVYWRLQHQHLLRYWEHALMEIGVRMVLI